MNDPMMIALAMGAGFTGLIALGVWLDDRRSQRQIKREQLAEAMKRHPAGGVS